MGEAHLNLYMVYSLAQALLARGWRVDTIQNHTPDRPQPHRYALAANWKGATIIFTHEVTLTRIQQLEDERHG